MATTRPPASTTPALATRRAATNRIRSGFRVLARFGAAVTLSVCGAGTRADPSQITLPPQYSEPMCRLLVMDAGRMIAWARWERRLAVDQARAAPVPRDAPEWVATLVQEWITDAYEWEVTDDQIRQWAAELGTTRDLPTTGQLSVHETIAIWLRRIARQCDRTRT